MSVADDVRAQLLDEVGARVSALGALLGPDMAMRLDRAVTARVATWAAQMCQEEDDRLAAQTVIDVMCVLWTTDPPHNWWPTPLGRVVARSLATDDTETVSQSVAAEMLGVHRGTVAQMAFRGTLDQHSDGSVLRSAVFARLGRRG